MEKLTQTQMNQRLQGIVSPRGNEKEEKNQYDKRIIHLPHE